MRPVQVLQLGIKYHTVIQHVVCLNIYTMRHKFSNFHLIFKLQFGMKMKRNKTFNPSIFDALAIIISLEYHFSVRQYTTSN